MKQTTTTITTATTTLIATAPKNLQRSVWEASVGVTGTFGGTAITWFWSSDGGTTKYPITSAPGTAISTSAADSFNIEVGVGGTGNSDTAIYATTTGGSGISLTVNVSDNS